MAQHFKELKEHVQETKDWLKNELLSIQTGRATPAILDGVKVESYGTKVPLNQIASITTEDARTIRVSPWDDSQVEAIEKAIQSSDMGISASSDDKGVRVSFPELTSDKRESLLKIVHAKHEEARVSIRNVRDEVWSEIQKEERDKEISEDEKFRLKDEMEKAVSEANKELDEIIERKEKDIRG